MGQRRDATCRRRRRRWRRDAVSGQRRWGGDAMCGGRRRVREER